MRKAPEWWTKPQQAIPRLYRLLGTLYQLGYHMRWWAARTRHASVPVICVGNVVAGGAGKTPTVIALVTLLKQQGMVPHILSRGYGGAVRQAMQVDEQRHIAADVGDEPLLLSQYAPCWVGRDRVVTAKMAIEAGADCLVMDDGLQNPSLYKDFSIIVVDAGYGLGNGATIPAGPLRESVTNACKRSQAVLMIGKDKTGCISRFPRDMTFLRGQVQADVPDKLRGTKILAFCGIARPQKFYDTLAEESLQVVSTYDFADHHPYTEEELLQLSQAAQAQQAVLVTTQKDWVRLPLSWRERIDYIPIQLDIQPKSVLDTLLSRHIR